MKNEPLAILIAAFAAIATLGGAWYIANSQDVLAVIACVIEWLLALVLAGAVFLVTLAASGVALNRVRPSGKSGVPVEECERTEANER